MVHFNYAVNVASSHAKTISYRQLKNIEHNVFSNDLAEQLMQLPSINNFSSVIDWYNSVTHDVVNLHAPFRSKKIIVKPNAPWFDGEYASLRRKRRATEKHYRKTRLEIHRLKFVRCTVV